MRSPVHSVDVPVSLAPSVGHAPLSGQLISCSGTDMTEAGYEQGFTREAGGGSHYAPFTPMQEAAHNRRMALLSAIPLPDLRDAVVVDYGTGAWGFAAVYPALHHCAHAVGMDISPTAVSLSEKVSAKGEFAYGRNVTYLTARGGDLLLDDDTVDVFFAGECIEHVEVTEAFVDEVHRVLKPGGTFILTTPNADAALYRARGERYCVGIEHVALMGFDELCAHLRPRFDVTLAWGFNNSLLTELDTTIDAEQARAWAAMFKDQPGLASGVIVVATPRADHRPRRYWQRYHFSDAPELIRVGPWSRARFDGARWGLVVSDPGCRLALPFPSHGVVINLWCDRWSGIARVDVDGEAREIDLYAPVAGLVRVAFPDLGEGPHLLQIAPTGRRHPRSEGDNVIHYQTVTFTPVPPG
jgi:SAM-dependent methyltransferase